MSVSDPDASEHFQLREYLAILRYRKWSLILVAGFVLLAGMFLSFRETPTYHSAARIIVKPLTNPSQFTINFTQPVNMDTEREVARSEGVAAIAAEILGQDDPAALLDDMQVTSPANTSVLEFSVTDPSPIQAQARANAFADAYLRYKREEGQSALENVRRPLEERLAALTQELRQLNRQIGNDPDNPPSPQEESRRDELTSEIAVIRNQLAPISGVLVDPGTIIESAGLPSTPASPNHASNGVLALFAGLVLGGGTALLRERLDDSLKGRTDLEEQSGAPVLAVIPKVQAWKKRDDARLITVAEPKSAAAEAYRTMRTSVLFAAAQRGMKVVLVASATAGEGKTTTAANLAVVLANADKRVILVNADLRKPRVHRFFQLENRTGVVNVIAGEMKPWEGLVDPGIENLRLLPSGPIPTRPAELLGSEAMGELLSELRQVADFIVIDSAPVLVVSDALALAPLCDGVLYVADADATTRGAVAHAREQLEQVGAEIVGTVLNNFDTLKARSSPYYYRYAYRYRYRYGHQYGAQYGITPEGEEAGPRRRRSSI